MYNVHVYMHTYLLRIGVQWENGSAQRSDLLFFFIQWNRDGSDLYHRFWCMYNYRYRKKVFLPWTVDWSGTEAKLGTHVPSLDDSIRFFLLIFKMKSVLYWE